MQARRMMRREWGGAAVLAALAVLAGGCVQVGSTARSEASRGLHPDAAADPLPLMEAVADWQLAQLKNPTAYAKYPRSAGSDMRDPRGWIQGALFVGLADLADRSADPRFAQAVLDNGAAQKWRPGDRLLHADDQAIGQSYVWAYGRVRNPQMLAPLRANFDAILADPPHDALDYEKVSADGRPCQNRWCWSDALFMAPPAWVGLSKAVSDPRYAAYADEEFWATTALLYDREEHLYYRDSRFLHERDETGKKIFWSRGNGWVAGGIVRVLEALPPDHPSRPRYEAVLREMSAKLITLQNAQGYWPVSLLAGDRYTTPETSGTAFFVYALAWGVNHGILDRSVYQTSIDRGWAALVRAVQPDGRLGWVQRVGAAPDAVSADDTQLYGVGAFLLAGGQVRDLRGLSGPVRLTHP